MSDQQLTNGTTLDEVHANSCTTTKILLPQVLAVEQDAAIALDLRLLLLQLGVETTHVSSGEEALTLVRQQQFDLIILGMNLPGIVGLEVCRRLKSDRRLRAIPVIFLTGETSEYLVDIASRLGAVDYLALPYETEDFKTRVRAHLPPSAKLCVQMDLACAATN